MHFLNPLTTVSQQGGSFYVSSFTQATIVAHVAMTGPWNTPWSMLQGSLAGFEESIVFQK